jgi:fatty-acyl-CoA synthase
LETLFALGLLGGVFVPLNARSSGLELGHNVADAGVSVLVYDAGLDRSVQLLAAPGPARPPALRHLVRVPTSLNSRPPQASTHGYEELIAASLALPPTSDEPVGLDDPCLIMYTSGTTGRAKGAVLTHGNITWNCVNVLADLDIRPEEVTLVAAPLYHAAALNMTCLPTLLKGGRVVVLRSFDPQAVLELVETERVTSVFGVPTMFEAIAAAPGWRDADLTSLRTLLTGGAAISEATIKAYTARGLTLTQGYGMTEASPGVLYQDVVADEAGKVGVPHFFTDVRVIRSDGCSAQPGERGEILVQGPNVMAGYWGLPEATAESMTELVAEPLEPADASAPERGWLRSGDVGVVDAAGRHHLVDRLKDVIISGGENIYPAEVETAILAHPDIAECAVLGVPDPRWGEVGLAVVCPRPGLDAAARERLAEDLPAFLSDRVARYKIPASVLVAEDLPRNSTGKVSKPLLRASLGSAAATGSVPLPVSGGQ